MKILHLYPAGNMLLAQYVSLLADNMPKSIETICCDDAKAYRQLCQQEHPDIVNVHGAMKVNAVEGPRLVVTPHGEEATATQAYVVIARSELEKERLKDRFCRIEVIRNPIVTRTTTTEILVKQTIDIYKKVMVSNVLPLMTTATTTTLSMLLKAGICGDRRWVKEPLPEQTDWQQLCIYAEYEGVLPLLQRGISVMGVAAPSYDTSTGPPYLPADYEKPVAFRANSTADWLEQLKAEISHQCLPLLRVAELHKALMRPELDEEAVLKELTDKKLLPLFASMLQLLKEQTLLEEGFMPCKPADNHLTEKLRNLLKNHQQI